MNSEQWQTAWRIFNAARELPSGRQRPYVESECADPEVQQRLFEELEALRDAEDAAPEAAQIDSSCE